MSKRQVRAIAKILATATAVSFVFFAMLFRLMPY